MRWRSCFSIADRSSSAYAALRTLPPFLGGTVPCQLIADIERDTHSQLFFSRTLGKTTWGMLRGAGLAGRRSDVLCVRKAQLGRSRSAKYAPAKRSWRVGKAQCWPRHGAQSLAAPRRWRLALALACLKKRCSRPENLLAFLARATPKTLCLGLRHTGALPCEFRGKGLRR